MVTQTPDTLSIQAIQSAIRDIPDYPKPGILFKDITTVLRDPKLFKDVIDFFRILNEDKAIDYVVGIESRGFILGAPLAYALNAGFVPIRKKGKLPAQVERHDYELEYGTDTVEIHTDAIPAGARVLLVDDLLATGGTAEAAITLLQKTGANVVGVQLLIELAFLDGRKKLAGVPAINALITYS
jgi:adenine phosphoribosyltransferase